MGSGLARYFRAGLADELMAYRVCYPVIMQFGHQLGWLNNPAASNRVLTPSSLNVNFEVFLE